MIHLGVRFGFLLVGTIVLTKKKVSTANDFLFHKLSSTALKQVPHGWSQHAMDEFQDDTHEKFVAQATIWKDRKQLAFLHNYKVKQTLEHESIVLCYFSADWYHISMDAPAVIAEYSQHWRSRLEGPRLIPPNNFPTHLA